MRILFIGNSHSYFNDLPKLTADLFRKDGVDCEVTLLAHDGWFLAQHVKSPDVRFNIRYGHYDYVVLQEHASPFDPDHTFEAAVRRINQWVKNAGAGTVLYMPWARKEEEQNQAQITEAHERIAEEQGILLAPVGKAWWEYKRRYPETEMYFPDGEHASVQGSRFAAKLIYEVIHEDAYGV